MQGPFNRPKTLKTSQQLFIFPEFKYDFFSIPYICNYCRQRLTVITWKLVVVAHIGLDWCQARVFRADRLHETIPSVHHFLFSVHFQRHTEQSFIFDSIIIFNGYTIFLQYRIGDFDFVVIVVYCTSNIVAVVCFASCKIILFVTKQKHEVLLLINYI